MRLRSLTLLALVGFAVLALPILLAGSRVATSLQGLEVGSEGLAREAVAAGETGRTLLESLRSMERSALQHAVVGDPSMLEIYRLHEGRAVDAMRRLEALSAAAPGMFDLRASVAALRARLDTGGSLRAEDFQGLQAAAKAGVAERGRWLDRRLLALGQEARSARESLMAQAVTLLAGVLAVVLFLTFWVSAPMRAVGAAIRRLGDSPSSEAIEIRGPRDLVEIGERLEWLRQRLGNLVRERETFLRHVSHDLKTPLASLREGTALLLEGRVDEVGQREVLEILDQNGRELQRRITNLIDFAAWREGRAELRLEEVAVAPLVDAVCAQHELGRQRSELRFQTSIGVDSVRADRDRLFALLDNLLSNAVAASPRRGTVQIAFSPSAAGNSWTLCVRDEGPGIPEADRERVFEAFARGPSGPDRMVAGSGIGLSVVRDAVHAHGGRVQIRDAKPRGAEILIEIPHAQA